MQIEIMSESAAAKISTLGAELQSLKDVFGTEYIWYGDKKFWGRHSPILFPIIGEQKNGEYEYNGKTYKMSRHGFLRDSEFEIVKKGKDNLLLSFSSNGKTKEKYPFDFTFQVSYFLEDTTLSVKYSVLNMGREEMYFSVGGHTGFNCPLHEDEKFGEYRVEFDEKETFNRLLLSNRGLFDGKKEKFLENESGFDLDHTIFDKDAVVPDNLKSKGVTLKNKKTGHGVHMDFSGFKNLAVWSEKGENTPFVCLEPWNGRASNESDGEKFTDKYGVIKLDAGKNYSAKHSITLI